MEPLRQSGDSQMANSGRSPLEDSSSLSLSISSISESDMDSATKVPLE